MHRKIGFISPNNSGLFLRNYEHQTSSIAGDKTTPRDYNCVEIHGHRQILEQYSLNYRSIVLPITIYPIKF